MTTRLEQAHRKDGDTMIDWNRVRELRSEIGAEDFDEIVEIFLAEVEEEITALRAGAPDQSLEAKLHFLKGSAMNLGFQEFADLCQAGERDAANGAFENVDLPDILKSYDLSKSAFLDGMETLAA